LIAKLQDLLRGHRMSGRTAATHSDAGTLELLADRAPMNAQLGTDLAQGPTLSIQVGRTLTIHDGYGNDDPICTGLDIANSAQ
jgi:hypothetical protein